MKIALTVQETLIWHDMPQLFVGRDKIGGQYLCLATDDEPNYVAVAISASRLQALKGQQIDLYGVFVQPELGGWFQVQLCEQNTLIVATEMGIEKMPERWLPQPHEFLPRHPLLNPETFSVLKVSAIAKEAGMNPTLLRQYISGIKRPSIEQARRVQEALHRVAERLLAVQFGSPA
jgi:AraC-like DNA-binding protein